MALVKYSPFNDLENFPVGLRAFQDTMSRLFSEPNGRPWVPPVDIQETENEIILKADVPDIDMKDIDVRLENGTLTIRGERRFESKTPESKEGKSTGGWHQVERAYGTFERSFMLPDTVDPESVKADYKNGTLTIRLAKKEMAKPRQIKVEVNQ